MRPEITSIIPTKESPYPIARPKMYETVRIKMIKKKIIKNVLRLFDEIAL